MATSATITCTSLDQSIPISSGNVFNADQMSSIDASYWWRSTGEPLRQMMEFADYPSERTARYLDFYRKHVCSAMGPSVPSSAARFPGSLTTDGTPIEYSFSFDSSTKAPMVRLSIDPDATSTNGLRTANSLSLLSKLPLLPECSDLDLTWGAELFNYFNLPSEAASRTGELLSQVGHKSQIMFGIDFSRNKNAVNAKVYFLPDLLAAYSRTTRWNVVRQAIYRLASTSTTSIRDSLLPQFHRLEEHISRHAGCVEGVRYLSIDLLRPEQARIKIYVRNPGKTFAEIWDFFTFHGQIKYGEQEKRAIQDLYACVQGESIDDAADAPVRSPAVREESQETYVNSTSAFKKPNICYFVMKNGYKVPRSKLFIRAQKPFAKSDGAVAQGLERWFRRWQWLEPQSEWAYADALKAMFPHRDLEDDGLHCWIGVSVKQGKLTVESYLTPELYKRRKFGN